MLYVEIYDSDGSLAHHDLVDSMESAIALADGRSFRVAEQCPPMDHKAGESLLKEA